MSQQFLKITYNLGIKKLNAYIKMPSPTFHVLKKDIELCLFEERQQPRCEIRTYWIDEDGDEIEIVNQCDYDIFMGKCSGRQHLQIAPVGITIETPTIEPKTSTSKKPNTPPSGGSYDFAVHDHVECDSCLMSPIIGFRYKCIQCPNYDLCQNCESKHIHSEHMMVRMPTNNCPSVVEAYVTGRSSSRKQGKRSRASCPIVKNGISVAIDDDAEAPNSAGAENGEQSSTPNGKERRYGRRHHRRHIRNNFFSNLYEMMNDLAEGGGSAAAAHAMGEASTSSKSATSSSGSQTNNKSFTSNVENPVTAAAAAATAAGQAAEQAHETAAKAAEIAAKVAHATALKAAQNLAGNMAGSACPFATTHTNTTATGCEEKEKVDATTSPRESEPQPNTVPVFPSPSLEGLAQFLDPQYMKTGIQILNNFSDMFAKMLDPMENIEGDQKESSTNLRKNSSNSSKSSVGSNFNSFDSGKKSDEERSIKRSQEKIAEKKTGSANTSHVEIIDLGSDTENESATESFVKIYVPKKEHSATPSNKSSTTASSAQTTPPQSLDKANVIDFAQLSADLRAHIAEEATKSSMKSVETATDSVDKFTTASESAVTTSTSTTDCVDKSTTAGEPVVTTSTSTSTTPNKTEEKRAVPVYHSDQRINSAVHAMMAMGFSNEGACLTQLLESVNGNIAEALDLMAVAQGGGSRQ